MDSQMNTNMMFFHDDLIVDILLRLPVKSLIRFKSVCKSWYTLISDPSFTKSHFNLSVTHTNKLLYITPPGSHSRVIDVDTSIICPSSLIRLPRPDLPSFNIVGSCRGFILFVKYPHAIIWNPSTNVHKLLSIPLTAFSPSTCQHTRPIRFWCGFGYDTSNDDYFIVVGWHELVGLKTRIVFFSLRTNLWREIEDIHFPYMICFIGSGSGVYLNGAIHWLATRCDDANQIIGPINSVIIAFDLRQKNFVEIPLPSGIYGFFYFLKDLGGCLGVCHANYDKVNIWVMKEYNVQSSWTKFNFDFPTFCIRRSTPLWLTKDEKLVATDGLGHMVQFDERGNIEVSRPYEHDIRMMVTFSETLLSLPGHFDQEREGNG